MSYVEPIPPTGESFAGQFDRNGDDWLYRRDLRGPAYLVTDEERRSFIADFERWRDWLLLILLGGGMLVVTLALLVQLDPPFPRWTTGAVGGGALAALIMGFFLYAWRKPERSLAARTPVEPARSWAQAARIRLSRTPWSVLLWRPVFFLLIAALNADHLRHEWLGPYWMALLAAMFLWGLADIVRKWRLSPRSAAAARP